MFITEITFIMVMMDLSTLITDLIFIDHGTDFMPLHMLILVLYMQIHIDNIIQLQDIFITDHTLIM